MDSGRLVVPGREHHHSLHSSINIWTRAQSCDSLALWNGSVRGGTVALCHRPWDVLLGLALMFAGVCWAINPWLAKHPSRASSPEGA